jgi:NADPH2:quinone reductase
MPLDGYSPRRVRRILSSQLLAAELVRCGIFRLLSVQVRSNSMTHAIRYHKTGGPEVLVWEEVQLGKPGPGEARIRQTAVGLNFVDIYNRAGVYPVPLPSGLGSEGAGVVEEVGAGVTDLKPGDRVAYGNGPLGAYAEARLIPADRLIKLPDGIDDKTAAAMMLKGLTVQYLIRQTYRIKSGETILLHAAAGGVGLILGQWAKHLGVTRSAPSAVTRRPSWPRRTAALTPLSTPVRIS